MTLYFVRIAFFLERCGWSISETNNYDNIIIAKRKQKVLCVPLLTSKGTGGRPPGRRLDAFGNFFGMISWRYFCRRLFKKCRCRIGFSSAEKLKLVRNKSDRWCLPQASSYVYNFFWRFSRSEECLDWEAACVAYLLYFVLQCVKRQAKL